MNIRTTIALCLTIAICFPAFGGEAESTAVIQPKVSIAKYDAMPKDPLASALFSATVCGTGQIYNKEYVRGIITGVAFWTSFFGGQYLLYQWQQINTDTFYLQDYFTDSVMHPVYVMHPDDRLVGLPTTEKALLVSAVVIGVSAYVFGIIDSYNGARRCNTKLFAEALVKPEFYCATGAFGHSEAGLRLRF